MLETKLQSAGQTARPRSSSSRLSPPLASAAAARTLTSRAPLTDDARRRAERAARRALGEQTRSGRMPRSEARLLTWAVTSAIVVCGLLVLYLAAYAHLTMLGIEQSKAKHDFHEKWQTNQMLRAQEAALKNPDRIASRAVRLGLTKDSVRVDYIRPAPAVAAVPVAAPVVLEGAAQAGTYSTGGMTKLSDDSVMKVGGEAVSRETNRGPKTEDNLAARND